MATMDDLYGDGSPHVACEGCGLCVECDGCECQPSLSHEADGCPTELAVLQREWREMRAELQQLQAGTPMEAPPVQQRYTVAHNRCNCHPETCGCNPWALLEPYGELYCTFFRKADADEMADFKNAALDREAEMYAVRYIVQPGKRFHRRVKINTDRAVEIYLDVSYNKVEGSEHLVWKATAYDNPMYEHWTLAVFPAQYGMAGWMSFADASDPHLFLEYLGLSNAEAKAIVTEWHAQGDWEPTGTSQQRFESHATHFLHWDVVMASD